MQVVVMYEILLSRSVCNANQSQCRRILIVQVIKLAAGCTWRATLHQARGGPREGAVIALREFTYRQLYILHVILIVTIKCAWEWTYSTTTTKIKYRVLQTLTTCDTLCNRFLVVHTVFCRCSQVKLKAHDNTNVLAYTCVE